MCTVTYLPLPREGFVLTSTRDEKNFRQAALAPRKKSIPGATVFFPRDTDAGGTWIATAIEGYTVCLLNGGFKIHESKPPYRLSRGLVLLDFYKYNNVIEFRNGYDFKGIEPFTLLLLGYKQRSIDELRWDGEQIHHTAMNPDIPGIWSSVTLYTNDVIRRRKEWFEKWLLKDPGFHTANAVNFHKNAGTGDLHNDILMNREDQVRTVSITSVFRSNSVYEMYYEDIISGKVDHQNISGNTYLVM